MTSYTSTCENFTALAEKKVAVARNQPLAFLIGGVMAGAYIGIALILALTCSAGMPAGARPLVNGLVFGIGLVLVSFAGAELFTGHVMYMAFGVAKGRVRPIDALYLLAFVWVGNLIGSATLAAIFAYGGGGAIFAAPPAFFHDLVAHKQGAGVLALLCRGALCNWLVCLAIWGASRIGNEAAKIWFMAWCLLAFVACGFEHSVANMTTFALGLLDPTVAGSFAGAFYNLAVVTAGNVIGGGLMVASAYLLAAGGEKGPQSAPAAGGVQIAHGAEQAVARG